MERERILTRHQVRLGESDREREGENSDNESIIRERHIENAENSIVNGDRPELSIGVSSQGLIRDQQGQRRGNSENSQGDIEQTMQMMQNKMSNIESSLQNATQEFKRALQNMSNKNTNNMNEQNTYRKRVYVSDDSDVEIESDCEGESANIMSRTNRRTRASPKLPAFTGKETWKVWFNRFEDVAYRQRWSNNEKLDELLPRLQGIAGDFVYGQLSQRTRSDYRELCSELRTRFRVIETTKTYGMQFSNRNQENGETVEEYAAELKMLYDKAHTNRDRKTRGEDLLRRFLDGLLDDKARFHVEFIKEPQDIDEAVYNTVCFQETKKRHKFTNNIRTAEASSNDCLDSDDDTFLARALPGKNKNKIIKQNKDTNTVQTSNNIDTLDLESIKEIIRSEMKNMKDNSQTQGYQRQPYTNYQHNNSGYYRQNQYQNRYNRSNNTNKGCYQCGDSSHYKRDCPKLNTGMTNTNQTNSTYNSQALN